MISKSHFQTSTQIQINVSVWPFFCNSLIWMDQRLYTWQCASYPSHVTQSSESGHFSKHFTFKSLSVILQGLSLLWFSSPSYFSRSTLTLSFMASHDMVWEKHKRLFAQGSRVACPSTHRGRELGGESLEKLLEPLAEMIKSFFVTQGRDTPPRKGFVP